VGSVADGGAAVRLAIREKPDVVLMGARDRAQLIVLAHEAGFTRP